MSSKSGVSDQIAAQKRLIEKEFSAELNKKNDLIVSLNDMIGCATTYRGT